MNKLEQTLEATARMLCVEMHIIYKRTSWCFHGKLHRDFDKPAIDYKDGSKYWYQYGKKHRDHDKPAVIYVDGSKSWYQYGKIIK